MDWQASDAVRAVMEKPILVLGCGSIGRRHIKNLVALGASHVVHYDPYLTFDPDHPDVVRDTSWMDGVSLDLPRNLEDALDLNPIAAIICTPTSEHMNDLVNCYNFGIHNVFVEKPLTNEDESYWIDERWNKVNTFVACNFRFTPGLQRVKQLIDDGAIGKVVSARAQFGQYLPDMRPGVDHKKIYAANKSMGGGCLLDGIHEFDYLCWLLGPIAEAKAFTARLTDVTVDTEDVAEAILRFESGALGSVHEDYVRRGYDRCCEIVGDSGWLRWTFNHNKTWRVDVNSPTMKGGYMSNPLHDTDMYLAEMQHFLRVCAGEEASSNTVAQAYRLLETILNAK